MAHLQAFLYSCDAQGRWSISTYQALDALLSAASACVRQDAPAAVLHVGFWPHDADEVAMLATRFPGELVLSDAAIGALGMCIPASATVIGSSGGVAFRLALRKGSPRRDGESSLERSDARLETAELMPLAQQPAIEPGDWVAQIANVNPDLLERAKSAGVVDESMYLRLEASLEPSLRHELGVVRYELLSKSAVDPATILDRLSMVPPWLLSLSLSKLALTVRQANVLRAHALESVADIAPLGFSGLMELKNLGLGSTHGLARLLSEALLEARGLQWQVVDDGHATAVAEAAQPEGQATARVVATTGSDSLVSGFSAIEESLSEADRLIWAGRLGYGRPQQTLQELADSLGLSRERVRQIEVQIFRKIAHKSFWDELAVRLDGALEGRLEPLSLDELASSSAWFAGAPALATALVGVMRHLLDDRFGVFQVGANWVVSHLTGSEWREACVAARTVIESAAQDRVEESVARFQCDSFLTGKGEELRPALWREVTQSASWISRSGQPRRLLSLTSSAESAVLAILESTEEPLHFSEIHRRLGDVMSPPPDVRSVQHAAQAVGLLFRRGVYGTSAHCPLSQSELAQVRTEAENLMGADSSNRQWHASELFDALLERGLGFDGRLTKYVVNLALKECPAVVDLRRMVWGLSGEWHAGAASRLAVRESVIDLLEREGRPMSTAEIRDRLAAIRGVNQTFQIFPSDPLVRIGSGLWGLMHRDIDVPGLMPHLLALRAALESRQTGLHVSELPSALGVPDEERVLLSLLAASDRVGVRVDRGEFAYLSEWDGPRRVSLPDAARMAVVEAGDAGVSFERIVLRVAELTQRDIPSQHVSQALNGLDLDFDTTRRLWTLASSDGELPT